MGEERNNNIWPAVEQLTFRRRYCFAESRLRRTELSIAEELSVENEKIGLTMNYNKRKIMSNVWGEALPEILIGEKNRGSQGIHLFGTENGVRG